MTMGLFHGRKTFTCKIKALAESIRLECSRFIPRTENIQSCLKFPVLFEIKSLFDFKLEFYFERAKPEYKIFDIN